jgi:hypothetical protein
LLKSGLPVYGFGEMKTPKPFVKACTKFTYIEPKPKPKLASLELKSNEFLMNSLKDSFNKFAKKDTWASFSVVTRQFSQNIKFIKFIKGDFGFNKPGNIINATELFTKKIRPECGFIYIKYR